MYILGRIEVFIVAIKSGFNTEKADALINTEGLVNGSDSGRTSTN
jgi:hypothetical protein